jgi:hypothetical protein
MILKRKMKSGKTQEKEEESEVKESEGKGRKDKFAIEKNERKSHS